MTKSERNVPVDAVKGLMIIFIIFRHSCLIPFLHHGYLGVDVFFMISGFYLMRHFSLNKKTTAIQYTAKRLRATYLPYLLAFALAFILDYKRLISFHGFDGFVETFAPLTVFLSLTEGLAIFQAPVILTGGWFLSVLIIGGFILYGLLEYNESLMTKVILPIGIITGYTFLFAQNQSSVESWFATGAISLPLLRGTLGMGMGILIYSIIMNNQEWIKHKRKGLAILSFLNLVLFVVMVISRQPFDCLLVIIIPLMLLGILIPDSVFSDFYKKWPFAILPRIGTLTLELFLIHYPAIHIVLSSFKLLGFPLKPAILIPTELLFCLLAALVLRQVCSFIRARKNLSPAS